MSIEEKTNAINVLHEHGYNTEEELLNLSLEELLAFKDISVVEMILITEIQKYVKENRLFSYLGGEV